jgi:glycosyltransferase involved in cell wall biosynthesis
LENVNEVQIERSPASRAGKRLVILSEFVDATQNSTGYYWSKIIAGLAGEFRELLVICPRSSYERVAVKDASVTYVPFHTRPFDKNRLKSRLIGQFIQSCRACVTLVRHVRSGDLVFSGTNPPSSILCIALLKKLMGFHWVLLVHDLFPENLAAAGITRGEGLLFWILRRLFNGAYASVDSMFAIGRDMLPLLVEKSRSKSKVVYISNWVDPVDVQVASRESNRLLQGLEWEHKVVFQFFGNLGRVQGLSDILRALALVTNERAAFIFIGSGAESDAVTRFIEGRPSMNIKHHPQLPFAENDLGLSACDVALVTLGVGMKGLAVPSKAYFSMAADKPLLIVADRDSELHRLWSEEPSIGWYCESGDPTGLARMIDDICEQRLDKYKGLPRSVLESKFSYADAVRIYAENIRETWSRKSR